MSVVCVNEGKSDGPGLQFDICLLINGACPHVIGATPFRPGQNESTKPMCKYFKEIERE